MKLVIIGNGFDLACGYKTSYDEYRKYLSQHCYEYQIGSFSISSIFSLATDNMWSNFEETLGDYDFESFGGSFSGIDFDLEGARLEEQRYRNEDLLENFKDIKEKLHSAICQSLSNFVLEQTVHEKGKINKKLKRYINNYNRFITFNYTDTLEELYGTNKKNICYIHGMADYQSVNIDDEQFAFPNIIFGHGRGTFGSNLTEDDEYNIFSPEKILSDIPDTLAKDYQFNIIETIFSKKEIKNLRTLVIIGHGLGKIDIPYFNKINEMGTKIDKVIYYNYDRTKDKEMKKFVKELFPKARIYIEHY